MLEPYHIGIGATPVLINSFPSWLDEDGKIDVATRFGRGVLRDVNGSAIQLDPSGRTPALSPDGTYFFTRTTPVAPLQATISRLTVEHPLDLSRIYIDPSPLHNMIGVLVSTKELLFYFFHLKGPSLSCLCLASLIVVLLQGWTIQLLRSHGTS